MAIEIETKINLKPEEIEELKENILKLGAVHIKKEKEVDDYFDFDDNRINEMRNAIRLRNNKVLCLKEKENIHSEIKEVNEFETEINNDEVIRKIFSKIGLKVMKKKEKIRDKYKLRNCELCIDELPFGFFLEIEGPRAEIITIAKKLGFNEDQFISDTYFQLYEKYCKKINIEFKKTNLVFKNE